MWDTCCAVGHWQQGWERDIHIWSHKSPQSTLKKSALSQRLSQAWENQHAQRTHCCSVLAKVRESWKPSGFGNQSVHGTKASLLLNLRQMQVVLVILSEKPGIKTSLLLIWTGQQHSGGTETTGRQQLCRRDILLLKLVITHTSVQSLHLQPIFFFSCHV